jgi:Dyp-type peroxidase family
MELERKDIQGLIVSSYIHLPCAAFLLLQVTNAAAARKWLARHAGEITTAENKQELVSTNLAFTHDGLRKLGLAKDSLASFSSAFQDGMASDRRSQVLGDDDENLPANWDWGWGNETVDFLLLLYALDENTLNAQLDQRHKELASSGGFEEVKTLRAGRNPGSKEHFGFADGIGQPVMRGSGNKVRQERRTHHATELPAGEFLLAHPNAYGVIADTPVVRPENDLRHLLLKVPDKATALGSQPGMHDLGRNGTYLVFRQLAQDVAKFWNFLDKAAPGPDGKSDSDARERLGAKFVGRYKSGAPLVLSPEGDNSALASENNFGYVRNHDAQGVSCPIGAHIRRSNPRDSIGPDPKTALSTANRHRLLRRGRSYGQRLENPLVDDGKERGLHFICLNSDIERQFEFVQQTWINNPVFSGLYDEVDPLVGNLAKGNKTFTVQADPLRTCVKGLCRFVTVKGGGYFFVPSIRALNYLASLAT